MRKIKLFTVLGLILSIALGFFAFKDSLPLRKENSNVYTIENRWELPFDLREISGISWLENSKIAAVQDEDGIIFVYNLEKKSVEKKIEFGQPGDYEGIAINGSDAYVMQSDGTIIEIIDFRDTGRTIKRYETLFTNKNNMESIEVDADANRLLISPKDHDLISDDAKGIYAFSLESKQLTSEPIIKIDLVDKVLKRFRENELYKTFRPSDLAVHPKTKEIYVLEGANPKLLIMDAEGSLKNAYVFDKKVFPQPEGITFSPDGTLYISSEGKGGSMGTITELKLKR